MDTFDRVTSYEDVREFFEAHKDRLFRYLVHKRMFTPYEAGNVIPVSPECPLICHTGKQCA